jgi:serine protease AprX
MTTVVCAGDGYLSKGLYKGVASDAELVLIKVQNEEGKITTENITKALEWVLQNHEEYRHSHRKYFSWRRRIIFL